MNNTSVQSESRRMDLAERMPVSVHAMPGDEIRCVRGKVWLTQEGDWRDYCLVPGVSFCIDRATHVVLHALDAPGAVVLERPAHKALGRAGLRIDSLEPFVRAVHRARREWISRALRALALSKGRT